MSVPLRFLLIAIPVMLLAVLVVWLAQAQTSAEDPVVEQVQAEIEPIALSPDQQELDREISRIGGTFAGHVGIAVHDIEAGETLHFNGLEHFPQQSVSKLWVAMTALDEVDAGRLDLAEMVEIRSRDLTVFYQPIRKIVRRNGSFSSDYADLIARAIVESDNTANDRVLRRVGGPEAVQDFLDGHGLASIRFGTDERTKQSAIAGLEWRQSYSQGPAFFDARDLVPDARRREAFETYLADPPDGNLVPHLDLVGQPPKVVPSLDVVHGGVRAAPPLDRRGEGEVGVELLGDVAGERVSAGREEGVRSELKVVVNGMVR